MYGLVRALIGAGLAFCVSVQAQTIESLESYRQELGFSNFLSADLKSRRQVKLAILDNTFLGYEDELGKSLPQNTIIPFGIGDDNKSADRHGLMMAQIVMEMLDAQGEGQEFVPELHLVNARGYSNFVRAVDYVIENKIDVVLYSQVWEYGGNMDSKGFINAVVSKAIKAGVLWVNATGNFHNRIFERPVMVTKDDWALLPGDNNEVRVECLGKKHGNKKKCQLRAILAWNDFKDDVNEGTDKDLDLVLTDDTGKRIAVSGLIQSKNPPNEEGYSIYPREIIEAEVKPGTYELKVKVRSQNFNPEKDKLRILVSGSYVDLVDRTLVDSVLPPSDHPGVIAVGSSDDLYGGISFSTGRPDLFAPAEITVGDDVYMGTSNSAAIVAAGVSLIKSVKPRWKRDKIIELLQDGEKHFFLPHPEDL